MKSKITKFKVQQIIFWPSQFFTEAFSSIFSYFFSVVFLVKSAWLVKWLAKCLNTYLGLSAANTRERSTLSAALSSPKFL